jgi:hypothetical protein
MKEWEAKVLAQGKLNLVRAAFQDSMANTLNERSFSEKNLTSMQLAKRKTARLKESNLIRSLTQQAKRVAAEAEKLEQKFKLELKKKSSAVKEKGRTVAETQHTQRDKRLSSNKSK